MIVVRHLHADSGSEHINHQVAGQLEKLRIEQFTKPRPHGCNDNAPVKSKTGTVIRKQLGYEYAAGRHTQQPDTFNPEVLSPYANYRRPRYFPSAQVDAKGKVRRRYRQQDLQTPCERLKSVPAAESHLRTGIYFTQLDERTYAVTDNKAARQPHKMREELFWEFREEDVAAI